VRTRSGFRICHGGGAETGITAGFRLDALEHSVGGGKASLILHASGGWATLSEWRAHTQFRWNEAGDEANVSDILAFVLGRAGVPLEVRSASALISVFFPDFTVHPGIMAGRSSVNCSTWFPMRFS